MAKTTPADQRKTLLALIQHQTPPPYRTQAKSFAESAEHLKISPITIDQLFLLGQAGTDNQPYDLQNLRNLEFNGIDYDVKGTSVTGQAFSR
ncbi:hypothetical protein GF367_01040, partial [Candidatus Woesearchaeota archaeon]|nr:hypothetical protein [Candidatus Woesearchaeota archaeon]